MTSADNDKSQQKTKQPRKNDASLGTAAAILIVATIVFVVVNGPQSNASNREETLTKESDFSSSVILGGIERRNTSSAFRGADASALLGGVKLDLSDATMEGDQARIHVSAFMGGVELRIPRDWTVVNHVTPVMGGVEDHTRSGDGSKRLVVEGTVFMGGLEIRN